MAVPPWTRRRFALALPCLPTLTGHGLTSALAAAATLAAGCQGKSGGPAAGAAAPRYRGTTLDGRTIALDDLRGQVVLVNVWATWCPPCREELPELQRLHLRHLEQGFTVLAISIDAPAARPQVQAMVRGFGLTFPVIADPESESVRAFAVDGYPTSVLYGRGGQPLWRRSGIIRENDAELATALQAALAAPVPPPPA
jgi:peroxiredoxin